MVDAGPTSLGTVLRNPYEELLWRLVDGGVCPRYSRMAPLELESFFARIPASLDPATSLPAARAHRKRAQICAIASLVEQMLPLLPSPEGGGRPLVVDFCGGSGLLGLVLASLFPHVEVCLAGRRHDRGHEGHLTLTLRPSSPCRHARVFSTHSRWRCLTSTTPLWRSQTPVRPSSGWPTLQQGVKMLRSSGQTAGTLRWESHCTPAVLRLISHYKPAPVAALLSWYLPAAWAKYPRSAGGAPRMHSVYGDQGQSSLLDSLMAKSSSL